MQITSLRWRRVTASGRKNDCSAGDQQHRHSFGVFIKIQLDSDYRVCALLDASNFNSSSAVSLMRSIVS